MFAMMAGYPAAAATSGGYNVNPAPTVGQGAFGAVPGPVGLPDPYADLSGVYPNLPASTQQASASILSKLRGEVSPATQAAIQDAAARFGVTSGMPGSGLAGYKSLRDLGLFSENEQAKGVQELLSALPTFSSTMTVRPETKIALAQQNALNAAAPDPYAAASYSQQLFNQYLQSMSSRGPAGGMGGTSGTASSQAPIVNTPTSAPMTGGASAFPTAEDAADWGYYTAYGTPGSNTPDEYFYDPIGYLEGNY